MFKGTCRECSRTFENSSPGVKYQWYCSRTCAVNYRNKNKAKYRTTSRLRSRSPEAFIRQLVRKKEMRLSLTPEYYIELFYKQNGKCAISGRDMTHELGRGLVNTNISIDRIDPSRGYEKGNIQLVCRQANTMKYICTKEELISWCRDIINNNKEV